jgi:MinD superfamily P-loop ATPase
MKELVIISGKGGTGKTSLTASFGYLARDNVLSDCDVDAADLHILAQPDIRHEEEFFGGQKARIDPEKCSECGLCRESCRFGAISAEFAVDPFSCEGCGVCFHVCPEEAVTMSDSLNGHWFISDTRLGPMVHAALAPGEENSGKLVALVRNQARVLANTLGRSLIISDGAPGVGCPVISSVTGADHVVVVTEPSMSGLHDTKRAVELVRGFKIPVSVIINKWDINPDVAARVAEFCEQTDVPLLGRIPYDVAVTKAMVQRRTPVEDGQNAVEQSIRDIWETIESEILSQGG